MNFSQSISASDLAEYGPDARTMPPIGRHIRILFLQPVLDNQN